MRLPIFTPRVDVMDSRGGNPDTTVWDASVKGFELYLVLAYPSYHLLKRDRRKSPILRSSPFDIGHKLKICRT
jgi:hypothetical protein